MASWAFIFTDKNFVPQGEVLNASDRQVALPLSKYTTASFKVRLDNPLADDLATVNGYIKAYRRTRTTPWSLRHFGPIISAEEAGDRNGGTIAVNSVGAGWILTKRIAGKSAAGTVFSTATDRALIVKSLIDAANAEVPAPDLTGETGITTDGGVISAASAVTYAAGPYKAISECMNDLSVAFDGFDWMLDPLENFANGAVTSPKIASFRAAPLIGTDASASAIFEWGTGRNNIDSYTRAVTRDTQANLVYHIAPSGPAYPVLSAIDAQSITDYRLLEDLAAADLIDAGMRQNLVNEHVKVRRNPKQIISFTPHIDPNDAGRLPIFGSEFDVGDTVRARVAFNGVVRFDVLVRVYGISFEIDPSGVERQALTLVEEA